MMERSVWIISVEGFGRWIFSDWISLVEIEGADRDDFAFLVGILSLWENTLLSADEKRQNKLEKTAFGFWLKFWKFDWSLQVWIVI